MARRRPPVNASTDANQRVIVNTFRAFGWSVQSLDNVGGGVPDLLIGGVLDGRHVNLLVEIKNPKTRGKMRPTQVRWHGNWRGQVCVVTSTDEAMRLIGVEPRTPQDD